MRKSDCSMHLSGTWLPHLHQQLQLRLYLPTICRASRHSATMPQPSLAQRPVRPTTRETAPMDQPIPANNICAHAAWQLPTGPSPIWSATVKGSSSQLKKTPRKGSICEESASPKCCSWITLPADSSPDTHIDDPGNLKDILLGMIAKCSEIISSGGVLLDSLQ